tara:strand:- start:4863 stop:5507 length:645 start_codon:yes stop_codon:yes gene_type:complete
MPYNQGWMGQTSGRLGGGRPLITGPLISRQKRDQIKESVNKFTGGVKNLFTKDPLKDKYYTNEELINDAQKDAKRAGQQVNQSGGGTGTGSGSMLAPALGMGSAALDALDNDPGYGGMDVGKEALKYASMGAVAGPVGAAVGAAVGTAVGLVKKKKFEKQEKRRKEKERGKRKTAEKLGASRAEAEAFFESQSAGSAGVYGTKDVDMFINKYAQ